MNIPGDLVLVGYVAGAYGLNGWVRIKPYASDAEALLTAKTWWFDKPELHDVGMMQAKMHSGDVVAQLMGVAGRDAAEGLRGTAVHVSRAHFPALPTDEFYWVDLIGLEVENLQGESLGRVVDMMDNGAHPILRVAHVTEATPAVGADKAVVSEMLIPFVDQFIKTVDQGARKITVDWGLDY
ncbi:MAG: ribosome maturation factor RimM [Herminiimonas sp.]|nr:ribosome maturation factor RimM [Herminiimonas sp.]